MYKLASITSILFITIAFLGSCSGQDKVETAVVNQSAPSTQYQYVNFNKIVFNQEGEFNGLELFDDRVLVKTKLPEVALLDESEDFLYYEWKIDGNTYKLDLFFNNNDQLKSIDGYVSFYTEDEEKDKATAELFYTDMEQYFIEKYGKENMESNEEFIGENDLKFISWYFDEKDFEVGFDDIEVYLYMSSYESLFEEEELETTK